jgi:CheY-like chemotaxis protein
VPGGEISLSLEQNASEVVIRVYARPAEGESLPDDVRISEMLKVARRLVELSGGRLDVTWNRGGLPVLNIHVGLPVAGEWVVLVLDDNLDVLRLVERYLTGSRYRLVGLQDPRRLMETVAEARPDIIVLDVMLPEVDGWDLLGRLREHPVFGEIPIVVSTILPQETLAMALGAKVFLPKPVSQEAFLKTLDKIVADLGKAPR